MDFWIECADSLHNKWHSPLLRVQLAPTSESIATMPTSEGKAEEGTAESASPVLADYTIGGDRGMLVLQTAEPDKFPVSPGQGVRYVTMRLGAIVGLAVFIAGGLLWFPGMRQNANFAIHSDERPKDIGKVEVRSTSMVTSPVAENDLAATTGKPIVTAPSLPAPEAAPTGGTPTPMQVAKGGGKVEVQSANKVESPIAENDPAATIGKPVAAAPSLPAPEVAPTGGTATAMQVAHSSGKVEAQSATKTESFVAENDVAATIGKLVATEPSFLAPEVAPTGRTPMPIQVAKSNENVEVQSAKKVGSESAPAPVASGPASGPALARGAATQLDNDEIAMLVTRGKDFLKDGDLASARLLFRRAAAAGDAEATFILGMAPFVPDPKVALTGSTSTESAVAPVASSPVSGSVLASGGTADNDEIAMLVTRGKDFLKAGDLVSARLLFQRAAAAGNAEASFILGTTFDPLFIRRMGAVGVEPDIARAREWYKRAAALGSADASQQLATLQQE
jgi:hypothetical protein